MSRVSEVVGVLGYALLFVLLAPLWFIAFSLAGGIGKEQK